MEYRISDAARAIGVSRNVLKNWLDRQHVDMMTPQTGGWLVFRAADIASLALVARLVKYGVPVGAADRIAGDLVMGKVHPGKSNKTREQLLDFWENKYLKAYLATNSEGVEQWFDTIIDGLISRDVVNTDYIILDAKRIIEIAYDRLDEISNED